MTYSEVSILSALQELEKSGKARFGSNAMGGGLQQLIATHHVKCYFPQGGYAISGRDSTTALARLHIYGQHDQQTCYMQVGNFAQSADGCIYLYGGEHHNDHIINNTFSSLIWLRKQLESEGVDIERNYSLGPITIGHNVTISRNVMIRSGVTIGDGAVIGMGAVVTKDVPPFAIVAGNPAQVVRYRFEPEIIEALNRVRWWDMQPASLQKHIHAIRKLSEDPAVADKILADESLEYHAADEYLVFEANSPNNQHVFQPIGVECQGRFTSLHQLSDVFTFFFSQFNKKAGEPVYYIEDVFRTARLVDELSSQKATA